MKTISPNCQAGKSTLLFIIIAAIAIAIGVFTQQSKQNAAKMPKFDKLVVLPKPKPLGEVNFTTHENTQFGFDDLAGKWSILFFAFTNCPDVCPSTLHTLKQVKKELVATNTWAPFQVIMVSVDPERDTPERLKQYVPFFDPEFIGLTANLEYTTEFAKNVGILFFKGETLENGGYDVDHGAALILVNPEGKFAGVLGAPHNKESLTQDLQKLGQYALANQPTTTAAQQKAKHSGKPASSSNTANNGPSNSSVDSISKLIFENAWVRPAPPSTPSMAGYAKVTNAGNNAVKIVDAESPLFDMVMIHQTVIEDGVASMKHMDGLSIDAGASAELSPMGAHLMLMRPVKDLAVGAQVPVRLTLESDEIIDIKIEVRDNPNE